VLAAKALQSHLLGQLESAEKELEEAEKKKAAAAAQQAAVSAEYYGGHKDIEQGKGLSREEEHSSCCTASSGKCWGLPCTGGS
jgi:hypothetical protein